MGGVRALPPPGLEQMMGGRDLQDGIQQRSLGGSRHQARAELAQHRAVEAGVGERQPEEILPVDPAPDGIGRLAIRQTLRELQQGHQGQAPWRLGRLALGREEVGEAAVVEYRAEPVAQAQQQIAARERQPRDMGRVVRYRQRRRRAQAHGQPRWLRRGPVNARLPRSVAFRQQGRKCGRTWNLITRTIVPLTWQPQLAPSGTPDFGDSNFGLGNVSLSLFLSPQRPGAVIWGIGPAVLLPTATNKTL